MNKSLYMTGRQPCEKFLPNDDLFEGSGNVHECIYCEKLTVSFCNGCYKDHHENGYNNCEGKTREHN